MITFLFTKLFYKPLPSFWIEQSIAKNKIKTLVTIANHGHYKDRVKLVNYLSRLTPSVRKKLILIMIEDPIEHVSIAAIQQGKKLFSGPELKIIVAKEKLWEEKSIAEKQKQEAIALLLKDSKNYKRKFGDGQSLKNVKQMLKRNLHGGKWF